MPLRHMSRQPFDRECLLDQRFGIGRAGQVDAAAIEHERQRGLFGILSVVGEFMVTARGAFIDGRHEDVRVPGNGGLVVLAEMALKLS